MLAQSFVSAAELGITEPQRDALQKVLVLLETGKLRHVPVPKLSHDWDDESINQFSGMFNMGSYIDPSDCGTVACIGGTAAIVGNVNMHHPRPPKLMSLFYADYKYDLERITPAQAARALRSYLTCGDAKWDEAVA